MGGFWFFLDWVIYPFWNWVVCPWYQWTIKPVLGPIFSAIGYLFSFSWSQEEQIVEEGDIATNVIEQIVDTAAKVANDL